MNNTPINTNNDSSANLPTVDSLTEAIAPVVEKKISFDDFQKVQITLGKILSAEKVVGSEKLLKLSVDFAEASPRQVVSGIAKAFPDQTVLVGQTFPFITNLEPRMIMGLQSQAMILAASHENNLALLKPTIEIPAGTKLS